MLRFLRIPKKKYTRFYHERVIDHFENPRNVGSFDKNDKNYNKNVGTGLVGAPACLHEDTLIAVADGRRCVTVKKLYLEKKIIQVWSYNVKQKIYEIKNARVIKNKLKKSMVKIILDDNSFVICTNDHKLLLRTNEYVEVKNIKKDSIVPFKRTTTKRGYWEIRNSKNRNEYQEIFKFHNPEKSLEGYNIHHKDFSKTNDNINNLQYLTIKEHIKIHPPRKWTIPKDIKKLHITKEDIQNAINNCNCRAETADLLDITHNELYDLIQYYKIDNHCERKNSEDIREAISERMKINNPYSKFTDKQKIDFASHQGETNGRFLKITNEELLKIGKKLIEENKKLTVKIWIDYAKTSDIKIPQGSHCIKKRFNINTWQEFVEKCNDYNHKIINIEELEGDFDCYDLQVENNNNFAVISKVTKNIHNGMIFKNCGDVIKLQIKVEDGRVVDSRFKTFGCLAGNVKIATPKGYSTINTLSIGDTVYAWNGNDIVENEIQEINHKWVNYKKLLRFEFEGSSRFKLCSDDHIWWLASDKPIEASDLEIGDELIHITENKLRSRNNIKSSNMNEDEMIVKVQNSIHNGLKVIRKSTITHKGMLRGLERDGDNVKLYDIRLKEGANVFFAGRVGTHNCGSAVAASSLTTELVKGKTLDECRTITDRHIHQYLNLPPVKAHCAKLSEDAINAALDDYKKKQ